MIVILKTITISNVVIQNDTTIKMCIIFQRIVLEMQRLKVTKFYLPLIASNNSLELRQYVGDLRKYYYDFFVGITIVVIKDSP